MQKRKLFTLAILSAVALIVCLYTQQHLVDRNGIPLHAISVNDIGAHSESSLVYPGARWMSEQTSAQHGSTTLWIQVGAIVPAQASGTYQTTAPEATVIVWYEQWLRAHRWAIVSDQSPADVIGIRYDRSIMFSRGGRERYSLFVDAFPGGTQIHALYIIKPFSIVGLFA